MDDEGSDWLSAAAADEPSPALEGGDTAAVAADVAAPQEEELKPQESKFPPIMFPIPPKVIYKHWARPRFLQYDYLYHYMHNYYDDVIEFLDRRMRGYEVEAPKPQTWAERALRTYTRNTYPHSVTYNIPVPRQKCYPAESFAPPHKLSYFRSATSTLVSTDTRLITKSRFCLN